MRSLVVVVLLAGCMESVTLVESGDVRISVRDTMVAIDARGDRDDCVRLPESLHGAANGRRMTVVSRGDQETHGEWDVSESDGDGRGYEPAKYKECFAAELAMPLVLEVEQPADVVIEIADESATFVATYPALFTPTELTLMDVRVVDEQLVVSWTASRALGSVEVEKVTTGSPVNAYWDASSEGTTVSVTFPEPAKIDRDARYLLRLRAAVSPTTCEGFAMCDDARRVDALAVDRDLVEMALALID